MSATVKKLLKSDSICENYTQMKKGPVFLTHSVYIRHKYNKASSFVHAINYAEYQLAFQSMAIPYCIVSHIY